MGKSRDRKKMMSTAEWGSWSLQQQWDFESSQGTTQSSFQQPPQTARSPPQTRRHRPRIYSCWPGLAGCPPSISDCMSLARCLSSHWCLGQCSGWDSGPGSWAPVLQTPEGKEERGMLTTDSGLSEGSGGMVDRAFFSCHVTEGHFTDWKIELK